MRPKTATSIPPSTIQSVALSTTFVTARASTTASAATIRPCIQIGKRKYSSRLACARSYPAPAKLNSRPAPKGRQRREETDDQGSRCRHRRLRNGGQGGRVRARYGTKVR